MKINPGSRIGIHLLLSTIPIIIIGFFFKKYSILVKIRTIQIVSWATLIFGLFLWIADNFSITRSIQHIKTMHWSHAVFIGCIQILALIPGTSRSGVTITALRFIGYNKQDSLKFSILLSIPTILGASLLAAIEIHKLDNLLLIKNLIIGFIFSLLTALVSISIFFHWIKKISLTVFAIYRIILGVFLLFYLY